MNQRTFIQTWVNSIIQQECTTTGKLLTNKYRNWEIDDNICKYKNNIAIKYIHGLFLINSNYKWINNIFTDCKLTPVIINNFESFEFTYASAISRFIECAENSYYLSMPIYQIIHNCNYKFGNKYLDYCKTLSYKNFVKVTSKHRARRANSETLVLKGLWYERQFNSKS